MTLSDFKTAISSIVGLDATADATLMTNWVNEGYVNVVKRTHCNVLCADMDLTSGTWKYTWAGTILAVVDAWLDSGDLNYRMQRKSVPELVDFQVGSGSAAAPSRYYATAGSNLIMFYPTPSTGETFHILYVPRPTALSAAGDAPDDVPAEFHWVIEQYALSRAADFDDDSSSGMGSFYLQKYEQGIAQMKQANAVMGGSRLAPYIPGRRRRIVPSVPSQDIS